jgi:hypothetical protein
VCSGVEIIQQEMRSSSSIAVSLKRQSWRESVIIGRANGLVRNRGAYIRAAMPKFIADESHEVGQYLVGRLIEYIEAQHPSIGDMKSFLKETAAQHDLSLPEDQVECVIEVSYFKWKSGVAGQNPERS